MACRISVGGLLEVPANKTNLVNASHAVNARHIACSTNGKIDSQYTQLVQYPTTSTTELLGCLCCWEALAPWQVFFFPQSIDESMYRVN